MCYVWLWDVICHSLLHKIEGWCRWISMAKALGVRLQGGFHQLVKKDSR